MNDAAKHIINKVTEWATKNDDIVYAIVTGSRGRSEKQSDEYSDIDLVLFSKRTAHYDKKHDWLSEIGEVVLYFEEMVSGGIPTRRVYFSNGVGMDILFVPKKALSLACRYVQIKENKKPLLRLIPSSIKRKFDRGISSFSYHIHRGYHSLVDKENCGEKLAFIESKFRYKRESAFRINELETIVNKFWYKALHVAVKLYRRESFTAKIDGGEMTWLVLSAIELHTKVTKGKDVETWHRGRYIDEWADPFIARKLNGVFGSYDLSDSWKSLLETTELFSEITQSILSKRKDISFSNPEPHARKWIKDIYAKTEHSPYQTSTAEVPFLKTANVSTPL